eukprot:1954217-Amphidinium_carterae.1
MRMIPSLPRLEIAPQQPRCEPHLSQQQNKAALVKCACNCKEGSCLDSVYACLCFDDTRFQRWECLSLAPDTASAFPKSPG